MSLFNGEKMHSLEGAFSESLYIYGSCIEKGLQFNSPKVLSLGLGLGYNEIIALALFSKNSIQDFQIHSFEKVNFLSKGFRCWISEIDHSFIEIHQKILNMVSSYFNLSPHDLLLFIKKSMELNKFVIHSELPSNNGLDTFFNIILYDAFSSGTDSALWTQDHLSLFLSNYCDDECLFTTYAATGNLKRALKNQNFILEKKKGFGVKRESTLAQRGRRTFCPAPSHE